MRPSRLLLILFSSVFHTLSFAVDSFFQPKCLPSGNFTDGSAYQTNLNSLFSQLSSADINYGFYIKSQGESPDQVYAIGLCRGDEKQDDCQVCLNDTNWKLQQKCSNYKEAIGWSDVCMFRYANRAIFGKDPESEPFIIQSTGNTMSDDRYNQVNSFLSDLTSRAATGNSVLKYAAGNNSSDIYALVQCTPDLSPEECNSCLGTAKGKTPGTAGCNGMTGCRVLLPSCNLRYETYPFFHVNPRPSPPPPSSPAPTPPPKDVPQPSPSPSSSNAPARVVPPPSPSTSSPSPAKDVPQSSPVSSPPATDVPRPSPSTSSPPPAKYVPQPSPQSSPPVKDNQTRRMIVVAVASILGILLLVLCIWTGLRFRKRRVKDETIDEMIKAESLQYDFSTVRAATNNFCDQNKLGQGGFGAVYKGQLPNGQVVAIKKLFSGSRQGDSEFKNEVFLVAKLQHRNLVKLLGFCLEGNERLLIFEFVPNGGLDHFIFDPIQRAQLNWERCYKIIGGIARGLLYLHEDSRLKVIHRDIKASNILLDGDMNPKIADFGLARLFVVDETHDTTSRIAGTLGYMAPEYVTRGRFSIKTDVFSFGIIILEIVSGQKNNAIGHEEDVVNLISIVWKNWTEGTPLNIVDPKLHDGSTSQMMRCIHIGLLCVQENLQQRPTMSLVVAMLAGYSATLPVPSHPAFLLIHSAPRSRDLNSGTPQSHQSNNGMTLASTNQVTISELNPR